MIFPSGRCKRTVARFQISHKCTRIRGLVIVPGKPAGQRFSLNIGSIILHVFLLAGAELEGGVKRNYVDRILRGNQGNERRRRVAWIREKTRVLVDRATHRVGLVVG